MIGLVRRKYLPLRVVAPGMKIDQAIIDRARMDAEKARKAGEKTDALAKKAKKAKI